MKYLKYIILAALIAGCQKKDALIIGEKTENIEQTDKKVKTTETQVVDDNREDSMPIKRSTAAKTIALTFYDKNSIIIMDREIDYTDSDKTKWYDKYLNAAFLGGLMGDGTGEFRPEDNLTIEEAQIIINKINPAGRRVEITPENRDRPISFKLWTQIFFESLEDLENYQVVKKNIVILASSDNNSALPKEIAVSDVGPIGVEGFETGYYIDMETQAYLKENDLIGILGITSVSPTIKNAFVVANSQKDITIFCGGAERSYSADNIKTNYSGVICDVQIKGSKAVKITPYDQKTRGTIKSANKKYIELEDGGAPLAESAKIYSIAEGEVKWKAIRDLIVGTDLAYFVENEGAVIAAVITEKPIPKKIRVAVSVTDFKSLYHEYISVTGPNGFTVEDGSGKKEFAPGAKFEVENWEFDGDRITIAPKSGKLTITSIYKNNYTPEYRGVLEIANTDYGYVIVNELDLENYLYAVIPSEMPTSFGAVAAQTQAIVSRSYAINGFYANRYHEYGANIDDSVKCQVYNNIPETEISIDAVNATKGIAISYDGAVVDAVFCSTEAGVSANAGEVWADISANRFPSETKDYLKASIPEGFSSDEEYFTEFIKADKTKIDCYDKESPWFRWSAVMTAEQLTSSINNNIARLYEAYPSLIKTMTQEGRYRSRPIENVGFATDIEISTRGEAGNAMQMKITGTSGSVLINSEYLIRSVLAPKKYSTDLGDVVLNLADGSTMTNYGILPSAFFIIEKDYETNENGDPINNAIKSVTFYGGGNGHGVGLSQYGAKGMADLGFTPEEIIEYYFKGTRLINFYE